MKRIAPVLVFSLLAACTPVVAPEDSSNDVVPVQPEVIIIEGSSSSSASSVRGGAMMQQDEVQEESDYRATYSMYAPEVLADGQTKVFFFHAAWCPICRAADTQLREWYMSDMSEPTAEERDNLPTYSMYRVDYDTETDLKSKYGVTYQHTFVLVDGNGESVQVVQSPSDAALQALIGL